MSARDVEVAALRSACRDMLAALDLVILSCAALRHPDRDSHRVLDDCPVERRARAARAKGRRVVESYCKRRKVTP